MKQIRMIRIIRILFLGLLLKVPFFKEGLANVKAPQTSNYQTLLQSFDFYQYPSGIQVLTREELFKKMAESGLEIKIQKKSLENDEINFSLFKSTYIPKIDFSYELRNTDAFIVDPNTTNGPMVKSLNQTRTFGFNLNGKSPWGLDYHLKLPQFTKTYTKDPSASSKQFSYGWNIGAGVQLLKGSYFFLGMNPFHKAEKTHNSATNSKRSSILSALYAAQTNYFNIFSKQAEIRILEFSLKSSQALRMDLKEMFDLGDTDQLSINKVDLQIRQTEHAIISAKNEIKKLINDLKEKLGMDNNQDQLDIFPDPKDFLTLPSVPELNFVNDLQYAKENNPSYLVAKLTYDLNQLNVESAKNETIPQLTFSSDLSKQGTDGSAQGAYKKANSLTRPDVSVALTFTMALFNDPAQYGLQGAKVQLEKSRFDLQKEEKRLEKTLENSINDIKLSNEKLEIIKISRDLIERTLKDEYIKYRLGESSIKNIVDYQFELNNERKNELNSRIDYLQALANYYQVLGKFPENVSVK